MSRQRRKEFGLFRLPRITRVAQKFLRCGDYTPGADHARRASGYSPRK